MRDYAGTATLHSTFVSLGVVSEGASVNTVIAHFHHSSRDLVHLECALVQAGAADAFITGYTVALTFPDGSEASAVEAAHRALDQIGATKIKLRRRRVGSARKASDSGPAEKGPDLEPAPREDHPAQEATADFMAKVEMGVFGHP
jgi:hypothetical protein